MGEWVLLRPARTGYRSVLELQRRLADARSAGVVPDVLILVEHEPVVTLGRRMKGVELTLDGVECVHVERGGLATYHGPGQLVLYPIVRLSGGPAGVRRHVHALEEVGIRTLRAFGMGAERDARHRGVWSSGRKVAAVGVAVRRGVAFHGLALNVDPDMRYFALIEPCGLPAERVTSMSAIAGRAMSTAEVEPVVLSEFREVYGCTFVPPTRRVMESIEADLPASGTRK